MLDDGIDNLRSALDWGLKHDPVSGLRLALALGEYWDTRGMPDEQNKWTNALMQATESDATDESHILRALAKIEMGRAAFRENDHALSTLLAEEVTKM